jgi:hypothetical protein
VARDRVVATIGALVVVAVLGAVPPAVQAGDDGDVGDVLVVDRSGQPLRNGGSTTEFSLQLPLDATCPGDSMIDQWRVQSFIIPAAVAPADIRYGVIGPEGDAQYALFAVDTRPLAQQLTLPNQVAGKPAGIGGVPLLSFAVMSPGMLPPGAYRIGIACTLFGETARYWDADIVLETDPNDRPAQFVWRLPDAPRYTPPADRQIWRLVAFGAAALVLIALVWIQFIRPRLSRHTPKESS